MQQDITNKTESLAEVNEQVLRENAQLRLENEQLRAKLKELQPLKHKLQVAEQALLFNSDLMSKYMESPDLRDQKLARSENEAQLLNHKLKITEQALLYNNDKYFQILVATAAEKEKELEDLRRNLKEKEEQLRKMADAELQPLKQKLRITEQALLYNSDRYVDFLESQAQSGSTPSEDEEIVRSLKNKLQVAEQALIFNSDLTFANVEKALAQREEEVHALKSRLTAAEERIKQVNDSEILPLKQKLRVAEQALLYYSDFYLNQLKSTPESAPAIVGSDSTLTDNTSSTSTSPPTALVQSHTDRDAEIASLREQLKEAENRSNRMIEAELQPLKKKLKVAEQALMFNSTMYFYFPATQPNEIHELRQKLESAQEKVRLITEAELLPLKQKLIVAEQALLYNSDQYFQHLQNTNSSSSENQLQLEIEVLRKKLKSAEDTTKNIVETELLPLKHKLIVAEQALLYNSDLLYQSSTSPRTSQS